MGGASGRPDPVGFVKMWTDEDGKRWSLSIHNTHKQFSYESFPNQRTTIARNRDLEEIQATTRL